MGLILDSSILIAAERRGLSARGALTEIAERAAGEEIAISVVTLMEMAHGVSRSLTADRRVTRARFLDQLRATIQVVTVSEAIALRAGEIDGECRTAGVSVALADLLIGITALELSYRVATLNVRHFRMIPGLKVESW